MSENETRKSFRQAITDDAFCYGGEAVTTELADLRSLSVPSAQPAQRRHSRAGGNPEAANRVQELESRLRGYDHADNGQ